MSKWSSSKAKRVLAALFKIGWHIKRQTGSHRTLAREGWSDFVVHDLNKNTERPFKDNEFDAVK
ncbi:MAG: type II toxin-antitoxin system HicA family toxin [Desulfamplus sp.]|nr:type II toxin-antitoxin system HicA family toxin [Desulfamplus sp.]